MGPGRLLRSRLLPAWSARASVRTASCRPWPSDAQGLAAQQHLVDFPSLTRERLREWREAFREGVRGLNDMIRALTKEIGDGPA